MIARPDVSRRHRERREQSRRRILDSARALLEAAPLSDVSIQDVAQRAELTRTAFYRHFGDITALLLALLDEMGDDFGAVADVWVEGSGDDPRADLRAALRALVAAFERHGRVLRAVADAATSHAEVATAYAELSDRLGASSARRIADDVARGASRVEHPEEVAAALVWMNERTC